MAERRLDSKRQSDLPAYFLLVLLFPESHLNPANGASHKLQNWDSHTFVSTAVTLLPSVRLLSLNCLLALYPCNTQSISNTSPKWNSSPFFLNFLLCLSESQCLNHRSPYRSSHISGYHLFACIPHPQRSINSTS